MRNADAEDAARETYPLGHAKRELAGLAHQAGINAG